MGRWRLDIQWQISFNTKLCVCVKASLLGCGVYVVMLNRVYSTLSRHKPQVVYSLLFTSARQAGTVWHRLTGTICGQSACIWDRCVCAFGYVWREWDCVCEISLCVCTSLQQCMCCTKVCVCVSAWHCSEPWCPQGSAQHTIAVVAEKGNSWHYWERDRVWTEGLCMCACACVSDREREVIVFMCDILRLTVILPKQSQSSKNLSFDIWVYTEQTHAHTLNKYSAYTVQVSLRKNYMWF